MLIAIQTGDRKALAQLKEEHVSHGLVYESYLPSKVSTKRSEMFRQELIAYTYKCYRKEKRELMEVNPDVAALIEDDEDLCEWPDFFDVDENVPEVPKAEMKPAPKIRGAQTMNDLLE